MLLAALGAHAQTPMVCGVVGNGSQTPPAPNTCPTCPTPTPSCFEVQNIRVNIHFLQHDDGTGNFGEFNDGRPGTPGPTTGYDYARNLMWAMNGNMDQNPVLNLAPGNSLTPIPKRVRWVLDGVFFDRSSAYRNSAGTTNSPFQNHAPLCVRADSVINIFFAEEIEWPFTGPFGNATGSPAVATSLANRGYVFSTNQADCNTYPAPAKLWAVVASPWTNYILFNRQPWQIATTINHELCHLLGLNHPFQGLSNCADAPTNNNCWNVNPSVPSCATQAQASNNLMDYNTWQTALSPCQVGIMQGNLNTCLKDRYVYSCGNCLPATATFDVSVGGGCMPVPIWLDARAAVNYGWYKLEIDQVTANGGLIAGTHYETTVWNAVLERAQLDAVYAFAASSTYRVKLTTHGSCGTAAVRVRTLTTPPCIRAPDPQRSAAPANVSTSTLPRK